MTKDLIVSTTPQETKVALLEDGIVSEIFIEREAHRGIVGNIYKGRVTRVLPGMQSAFVDLGLERDAFLYVADVLEELDENLLTPGGAGGAGDGRHTATAPIEETLREGQDVLVQVVKEPLGTEGRAHHHPRLPARPLPRLHAHRRARGRVAQDHGRRGAPPAEVDAQGDPAGARRRRLHRAHRGRRRAAARTSSATPATWPAPGTRCGRVAGARAAARPAAPRAGAWCSGCCATCSPTTSPPSASTTSASTSARWTSSRQLQPELAPRVRLYERRRAHPGGARRGQRAGARAALQGLAGVRRLHRHQPDRGPGGHRRQHRPLHGQEDASRRRSSRPTWRR